MNAFVVIFGGVTSSFLGGWISDKYEYKYPRIKGIVAAVGSIASIPFIVITYTIQPNFYVAMISYLFAYLTAEVWYGPAHA